MSFRRLSVLVADDCAYMRTIVSTVLRGIGFMRIGEASDGAEALNEMSIAPYDLLITDYAMPTIDGVELARLLRTAKDSPAPRIPILMMTAHTERARIMGARDAGVNEIVSKPLSAKTLLDRVIAIVDHPRDWIIARGYVGPDRRRRTNAKYDGPLRRDDDKPLDLDSHDWNLK
jgi:two-component system, chemotaxis family, chemotaxis protein CheY